MRSLPFAASLLALSLPCLAPSLAHACGGTFCDIGPNVMPVDQSGENILFWIDEGGGEPHTEAHIQIQYEGDAERFAWIVPVQQVPEVLVGNQALFDSLLAATIPVFTVTTNFEPCEEDGVAIGCGAAGDSINAAGDDGGFQDEVGDAGETGGVEILDRGFAGAFEYVTLTGSSVDEVVDWLDMAGYAQDDDAPPILQEYLDEGFVFVAFKLRGGADVDEIHPLAIRYPGTEPCIPIRLTRIAAVDDMAIRAFFLGTTPVAPQNWPHVVVNPAALDWAGDTASSYLASVSLAVDEAGGRAFVSEYVGTSAIVSTTDVDSPLWDPTAFEAIEPVAVYDTLVEQGLGIECGFDDESGCSFAHPQVEPLLDIFLPPPDGVAAYEFWQNLAQYEGLIDPVAWNGPGFASAFAERISTPGQHAKDMLAASTTLTRLFTLLSPHEMSEDPLFHPAEDLPLVTTNWSATQTIACEGNDWVTLPDGRDITLTNAGLWPNLEGMPYAERIEQVPTMGPPQVTTDNRELIDELLAAWNAKQTTGPQPGCAVGEREREPLLLMIALFGLAWLHRSGRRSRN